MTGKVVIVTGANRGIGFTVADKLAAMNATVILACRDMKKCREAQSRIVRKNRNAMVSCERIDLNDPASILLFVENFHATQLDVLIHNAGTVAGFFEPKSKFGKDAYGKKVGMTWATNYFGPALLTIKLMPLLLLTERSRILFTSTFIHTWAAGNNPLPVLKQLPIAKWFFPASYNYTDTKLAMIQAAMKIDSLVNVDPEKSPAAFALHPGITDTSLWSQTQLGSLLRWAAKPFTRRVEDSGDCTVYCAASSDLNGQKFGYYRNCKKERPKKSVMDKDGATNLWTATEDYFVRQKYIRPEEKIPNFAAGEEYRERHFINLNDPQPNIPRTSSSPAGEHDVFQDVIQRKSRPAEPHHPDTGTLSSRHSTAPPNSHKNESDNKDHHAQTESRASSERSSVDPFDDSNAATDHTVSTDPKHPTIQPQKAVGASHQINHSDNRDPFKDPIPTTQSTQTQRHESHPLTTAPLTKSTDSPRNDDENDNDNNDNDSDTQQQIPAVNTDAPNKGKLNPNFKFGKRPPSNPSATDTSNRASSQPTEHHRNRLSTIIGNTFSGVVKSATDAITRARQSHVRSHRVHDAEAQIVEEEVPLIPRHNHGTTV